MSEDDVEELARLLRLLADEGLGVPKAPPAVFAALRGVVAQPTVELLISGPSGTGAWLTRRDDRHWTGWHLPGGFVGAGEPLEEACARIGRVELDAVVTLDAIVGHHTWNDHPYASALSLLCRCRAATPPRHGRPFETAPDEIIPEHRAMLDRAGVWATGVDD